MRILFINPVFYPADGFGGPVTVTYSLSKSLARLGHEVTVYTTNAKDFHSNMSIEGERELEKNLKVFYFKNNARPMEWFISLSMITHILKNGKNFDVIHVHSYRQFQDMIMYFVSKLYGIDYVLTSHGYVLPMGRGTRFKKIYDVLVGKSLLKRCKRIFALTQTQAREYQSMGVSPERIVVIPNGVDQFAYSKRGSTRSKLGIKNSDFLILYLGRLHHLKGISFLIEGFSKLERNDVHLVVAGPDYGYEAETKQIIQKSPAKDRIHLIGAISGETKDAAILDTDFMIYPSLYDVFPMVPLEAAAAAKPVIITDVCEFSQVLNDRKAGIVIKAKSSKEIADAIEMMLDRATISEMGQNALKLISERYFWDNITQEYSREYEKMSNHAA